MPKITLSGTAIAATSRVSRIADERVGIGERGDDRRQRPCANACARTTASGSTRNSARQAECGGDQEHAAPGGSQPQARPAEIGDARAPQSPWRSRIQCCRRLIASSSRNETSSITGPAPWRRHS